MTEKTLEFLTQLITNELGEELMKELEIQGSQLYFNEDWTDYGFTKVTADQQRRIDFKKWQSLAIMKSHLN